MNVARQLETQCHAQLTIAVVHGDVVGWRRISPAFVLEAVSEVGALACFKGGERRISREYSIVEVPRVVERHVLDLVRRGGLPEFTKKRKQTIRCKVDFMQHISYREGLGWGEVTHRH